MVLGYGFGFCGFGVSILVCWPGSGFLLYVVLVGLLVGAA